MRADLFSGLDFLSMQTAAHNFHDGNFRVAHAAASPRVSGQWMPNPFHAAPPPNLYQNSNLFMHQHHNYQQGHQGHQHGRQYGHAHHRDHQHGHAHPTNHEYQRQLQPHWNHNHNNRQYAHHQQNHQQNWARAPYQNYQQQFTQAVNAARPRHQEANNLRQHKRPQPSNRAIQPQAREAATASGSLAPYVFAPMTEADMYESIHVRSPHSPCLFPPSHIPGLQVTRCWVY